MDGSINVAYSVVRAADMDPHQLHPQDLSAWSLIYKQEKLDWGGGGVSVKTTVLPTPEQE